MLLLIAQTFLRRLQRLRLHWRQPAAPRFGVKRADAKALCEELACEKLEKLTRDAALIDRLFFHTVADETNAQEATQGARAILARRDGDATQCIFRNVRTPDMKLKVPFVLLRLHAATRLASAATLRSTDAGTNQPVGIDSRAHRALAIHLRGHFAAKPSGMRTACA